MSEPSATPDPRRFDEIFIFCFAGDRIAEAWGIFDVLSQLRQLARLPAAASS